MAEVQVAEMLEAGAHFGHQTKRWNPKMKQYIYGTRSGVHILNLQRTKDLANEALQIITNVVASGKDILFVGTKPQARDVVAEIARECDQHYVNQRWMGGTLTNFKTIKKSIDRLIDLETRRENDDFKGFNKRELLEVDRTIQKLEASLGGIKKLNGVPDLVYVIDPKHEAIAILESKKLGIPVVAVTDSNCDPEPIDYVIPANDDAILSIEYFTKKVAEAVKEGMEKREHLARESTDDKKTAKKQARRKRVTTGSEAKEGKSKTAYVARGENAFEGDAHGEYSAEASEDKAEDVKDGAKKDSVAAAS